MIFVAGLHGNEHAPVKVIKEFGKKLKYLIASDEALKKNIRFFETDLNRSFPGKKDGSREERTAKNILVKLKKYSHVVDLHTATCQTSAFIILTKASKKHLKLAENLDVKKVVLMEKSIASGGALIDHVEVGISIECGFDRSRTTQKEIRKILRSFIDEKVFQEKEYFSVFKILKKKSKKEKLFRSIRPFKLVKKGEDLSEVDGRVRKSPFSFYPVLPRQQSYKGVLCLAAKKITKERLYGS